MDYPVSDDTVGLVAGKFSDGDPTSGIPASRWPSETADAIMDELIAVIVQGGLTPAEATLTQVRDAILAIVTAALGTAIPKDKFNATADPVVTNDSSQGYSEGSRWFNTTTPDVFVCINPAVGAAVWLKSTLELADLANFAVKNADNEFSAGQSVTGNLTIDGNIYSTGVVQAGVTL
ncbi:MAG: hypothetical protein ACRES7_00205 [Gammaproteobacteria bacterium]